MSGVRVSYLAPLYRSVIMYIEEIKFIPVIPEEILLTAERAMQNIEETHCVINLTETRFSVTVRKK